MDAASYPVRLLDLPDLVNARDLGNLPLVDGRSTAPGVLMRCETPDLLTTEGIRRLSEVYGVRHVLDLRAEGEGRAPVEWPGLTRHRLPMNGRSGAPAVGDVSAGQVGPAPVRDLGAVDETEAGRLYLDMAERGKGAFARALELLTAPSPAPAIVHCTAGKDRTGVLVALLLAVAGVDRSAIVADYAYTEVNRTVMFERIRALRVNPAPQPVKRVSEALRGARPATMTAFLDGLAERYGSAENFFLEAGAAPRSLDTWRRRMVTLA